ncbi:putative kinase [Breznakia blatticola]|uniref:Putative kinase n=1 Tax=Breznakia blatticola TaxID=1754012 RepID=A0A4R7ZJ34_9FIRM|nr:AAA family ATPase [Breznakia blatticola]TDW16398.1 putative kinase [Breznakia blatticola]
MNKVMVLVGGLPGTGKSYLTKMIIDKYKNMKWLSFDELKEKYWDEYGYNTNDEKLEVNIQALNDFYIILDKTMSNSEYVIIDYPFSNKQKDKLEELANKYNFSILTIRLLGDLDVLYDRQKTRDLANDRHLGHVMNSYHKGDVLNDRSQADALLTYDVFIDRCKNRGYDTFQLGQLVELDVTDYNKIEYKQLFTVLDKIIGG